jgi:hypothetical protein
MLSVLRHERIRHELWIDQDLVVERSLFASELFIVQRIVAVLGRHDGQWGVGGVVVAQERVVGGSSERGVFSDLPLFGEGIHGTLYAFPRTV